MRLTVDLILSSRSFTNAVKDRQIDLRGYKISIIENLGATQDKFDAIDLSDNEIRKLDNFPALPRLTTLYLHNNRITRISESIATALPNLLSLMLTNNQLTELSDLHALSHLKKLRTLSLLGNAVTKAPNYRLFVIHCIPTLKLLDFHKVRQKERDAALKMFGAHKALPTLNNEPAETKETSKLPEDVTARIQRAISQAKSLEEIASLERALKLGIVPENLPDDTPAAADTMQTD